jgi:hypothetical protein
MSSSGGPFASGACDLAPPIKFQEGQNPHGLREHNLLHSFDGPIDGTGLVSIWFMGEWLRI